VRRYLLRQLAPFERPGTLSRAQRAIVRLIVSGHSVASIARTRRTSARTVSNQLTIIRLKLRTKDLRSVEPSTCVVPNTDFWDRVLSGRLVVEHLCFERNRVYAFTSVKRGRIPPLSERERETLALATSGCSIKEISQDLGVTESSVDTYLRRGLKKLNITERETLEALGF